MAGPENIPTWLAVKTRNYYYYYFSDQLWRTNRDKRRV